MFSEYIKEMIDQKDTPRPIETAEKPSTPSLHTPIPETSLD